MQRNPGNRGSTRANIHFRTLRLDAPSTAGTETMRGLPRFTIGQLMLLVLLTGLALAPVSMYRQKAPIELMVVTIAIETIGLPTVAILLLIAFMAPRPERTRYIVLLSAAPVLLILGVFVLAEISAVVMAFGVAIRAALHGNTGRLFQAVYIVFQSALLAYCICPPRCPSCRRRRLIGGRSPEAGPGWQSMECRACGGHFRRRRYWIFPHSLQPEPGPDAVPEVQYVETHDS